MIALIERRKARHVKGPSIIRMVEERKKSMRHFYGTRVFKMLPVAAALVVDSLVSPSHGYGHGHGPVSGPRSPGPGFFWLWDGGRQRSPVAVVARFRFWAGKSSS